MPLDDENRPRGDDAYSRRRSNWLIWVAIALLVAIALYALANGLDYAGG